MLGKQDGVQPALVRKASVGGQLQATASYHTAAQHFRPWGRRKTLKRGLGVNVNGPQRVVQRSLTIHDLGIHDTPRTTARHAHSLMLGPKISRSHYVENFPARKIADSRVLSARNKVEKRVWCTKLHTSGLM